MIANIWVIFAIVASFLITYFLGKKIIPYLQKLKYGQTILKIGPSWHENKQGTPTMGGVIFVIGIYATILIIMPLYYVLVAQNTLHLQEPPLIMQKTVSGLLMALAYGAIGFLDDYVKVVRKRNLGLTAGQKLLMQFLVVGSYLLSLYCAEVLQGGLGATSTTIPFFGRVDLGVLYWPMASLLIVGMVNAVNLTDGIDGLCTSITFFGATFFMLISNFLHIFNISIVSGALVGGCLGFLIFNIYPAKVFMGDTGSLFLGGLICALAFTLDLPVMLPIIGGVYVLEMFSVILQVAYFKVTKGNRLFKMSPLHHHFEICGWSEAKICIVFNVITVVLGALAVILTAYGL